MKISKKILLLLLVLIIALISYGQTLLMNFYQDDAAVIFKLQHIDGPAGSYGAGPFGEGPYKYTITPFIPFYKFFGLNPFGYFFVGFLLFLLAAYSFSLLAKELFGNKKTAYFSTLIFAAGYVGSNSMLKISNSWQNNVGLIVLLLLLWSLVIFFRKNQLKFYLLSLGLFLASVQFIFIRSHSLIFSVLVLDVILGIFPFNPIKLLKMFIRQAPFWVIFYLFYLKNETPGTFALAGIFEDLMHGKVEILTTLFATSGSVFFPNVIQNRLINLFSANLQLLTLLSFSLSTWVILSFFGTKRGVKIVTLVILCVSFIVNQYFSSQNLYWYRNTDVRLSGALGMYAFTFLLASSFALWPKYKLLVLGILFGLFFTISQIFSYFIKYPEATFATVHRYLYYASVGYSLILGSLTFLAYSLLKRQKLSRKYIFIPLIPLVFVVAVNSLLSFKYQRTFVVETSRPTQQFYRTLKRDVPVLEKGSIFYFDVASDSRSRAQFSDFFSVGSMPNTTAIAIYYGVDRYDFSLITNYDELLSALSKNIESINKLHTFYYDSSLELVNTTNESRELLKDGSDWQDIASEENTPRSWNLLVDDVSPLSPVVLEFKAKTSAKRDIKYPYSQNGIKQYSHGEKRKMIAYLLSKLDYYSRVKISTLSEWMYQERVNLIDNDVETSWRGHRIYWHDNKHEQITMDLGQVRNVNKVVWTNWQHTLTPTSYTLLTSLDGKDWRTVKEVSKGGEIQDGKKVIEEFSATWARYVRMDITETLSNDAPTMSEIEVVDSIFSEIDPSKAENFINNPFINIQRQIEMNEILSQAAPLLFLDVEIVTDKGELIRRVPVDRINQTTDYSLTFSPGGTLLKNVSINLPYDPLELEVESAKLRNIGIREAKDRGIIKEFHKN